MEARSLARKQAAGKSLSRNRNWKGGWWVEWWVVAGRLFDESRITEKIHSRLYTFLYVLLVDSQVKSLLISRYLNMECNLRDHHSFRISNLAIPSLQSRLARFTSFAPPIRMGIVRPNNTTFSLVGISLMSHDWLFSIEWKGMETTNYYFYPVCNLLK